LTPYTGRHINRPKAHGRESHNVQIVQISPTVRAAHVIKTSKKTKRKLTVANWVFAQTTHVADYTQFFFSFQPLNFDSAMTFKMPFIRPLQPQSA